MTKWHWLDGHPCVFFLYLHIICNKNPANHDFLNIIYLEFFDFIFLLKVKMFWHKNSSVYWYLFYYFIYWKAQLGCFSFTTYIISQLGNSITTTFMLHLIPLFTSWCTCHRSVRIGTSLEWILGYRWSFQAHRTMKNRKIRVAK